MYLKNIFSSVVIQCARIVLKLIVSILVARTLGAENYGVVTYFLLVFGVVADYGQLGILNAVCYFRKKNNRDDRLQSNVNLTYLIINALLWFVVFLIVLQIDESIEFTKNNVFIGFIYIILTYLIKFFTEYCNSYEKLYVANNAVFFGLCIESLGIIVLFLINRISVWSYILLIIFQYFITVLIMIYKTHIKFSPSWDTKFIIEELKYGFPVMCSALFIYLTYRVDQFMIKAYMGNANLGVYTIATSIAELIFFIPNSFTSAIIGRLLNLKNRNDKLKTCVLTSKLCFYMCVVCAIIVCMVAPIIKIMYGDEYVNAIPCVRILLIGVCTASLAKVMYSFYVTEGQPRYHVFITFSTFVVNVIFNMILIPLYGINGAAIASTISYILYGLLYVLLFKFKENIKIKDIVCVSISEIKELVTMIKTYIKKDN